MDPKYGAVKNIVRKEENAGRQHFLLFSQCFLPYRDQLYIWGNFLFVVCKCLQFGKFSLIYGAFKIIVGKGENSDEQHFLRFPQCFLAYGDRY